jgi:uncharacterized protein YoxC
MQSGQILNLDPGAPGRINPDTPVAEHQAERTAESINHARFDIRRTQLQLEQQIEQQEAHEKRTNILTISLAVLVVFFGAALWFAYPVFRDHNKTLADMLGIQNFTAALTPRVNTLETKLDNTLPQVANRIDQMEASMKSSLQTVRNQAQSTVARAGQRIRDDVNRSLQAIQSRMTGIESNQKEAAERVAQLQNEVTDLKREITAARAESSAAGERLKQLQEQQQASSNEMSTLTQRLTTSQSAIANLNNRVDRKRIDFDVTKDKPAEIIPGVHLTVKRVDQRRQEMDGTLQLSADSPNLTIRGQGIQKPMLFHTPDDGKPIELVLTQVAKNRVAGYVLTTVAPAD